MIEVVGIRFKKAGKMYYFDPAGIKLEKEDGAIVETARGIEYGTVIKGNSFVPEEAIVPPLKQVMRRATEEDTKSVEQNHKKETEAFGICLEKISRLGLDMKLVDVEMTFDRNKLIFYFTSDGPPQALLQGSAAAGALPRQARQNQRKAEAANPAGHRSKPPPEEEPPPRTGYRQDPENELQSGNPNRTRQAAAPAGNGSAPTIRRQTALQSCQAAGRNRAADSQRL